jgi:hypothetical protein
LSWVVEREVLPEYDIDPFVFNCCESGVPLEQKRSKLQVRGEY